MVSIFFFLCIEPWWAKKDPVGSQTWYGGDFFHHHCMGKGSLVSCHQCMGFAHLSCTPSAWGCVLWHSGSMLCSGVCEVFFPCWRIEHPWGVLVREYTGNGRDHRFFVWSMLVFLCSWGHVVGVAFMVCPCPHEDPSCAFHPFHPMRWAEKRV